MTSKQFQTYLQNADFNSLFRELGWDQYKNNSQQFEINGIKYTIQGVAQKKGFSVLSCSVATLPTASACKRLDSQLRKVANDYILIFQQQQTEHHLWAVPIKMNEKRQLVFVEYSQSAQTDFLYQKIGGLTFGIRETVHISDVKERIQKAFFVNSENITKAFYDSFRKEHKSFATHIQGLNEQHERDWYTSVMLNRLMLCYFIQKKGFLNLRTDYLQNRLDNHLQNTQQRSSFYKDFLIDLFHEGLNSPNRTPAFKAKYGRIPYLNGGMFGEHEIERKHTAIDIDDEAFVQLFSFFDKWQWHLDTRQTSSGKDINPDVLGYIFEQYINDRAETGAYYTKEDVTEYISKNCIIPCILDKLSDKFPTEFGKEGYVWSMLQKAGDKYIYDVVKKGVDHFQDIPQDVALGIDPSAPNLLQRREHWNEKTPEIWALPTEIWRESIERMQYCKDIQQKIQNGEIHKISDLITYNLDIRAFCEDLVRYTDNPNFVLHFYHILHNLTVLDPTCGSGAFLFAALNILEPLYEICIDRMQEFNEKDANLFSHELDEITAEYNNNTQYYIYKSIILRNLYGVDIMVEATEIAKLRLFLKMVAAVEVNQRADNLGLDPLPDVDFNIRCGNTLVGYASYDEVQKDLVGNAFVQQQFINDVKQRLQDVSKTYYKFRDLQLKNGQVNSVLDYKQTKLDLQQKLNGLVNLLDNVMHTAQTTQPLHIWRSKMQPFHWLAEYYQIVVANGGFDVIIGNPPYVTFKKSNEVYGKLNYKTLSTQNLYPLCVERSESILNKKGRFGMILPLSAFSTENMKPLMKFLDEKYALLWLSFYHFRPARLFDGGGKGASIPTSIIITERGNAIDKKRYSTGVRKFTPDTRWYLFGNLSYTKDLSEFRNHFDFCFPKLGNSVENNILDKIFSSKFHCKTLASYKASYSTNDSIYYRSAGGLYWKIAINFPFPYDSLSNRTAYFHNIDNRIVTSCLNSSLQSVVIVHIIF